MKFSISNDLLVKGLKFTLREKRLPSYSEILKAFNIKREKMPLPVFIQLEPTTKCNLSCIMCTRHTLNPKRLNKDLTLENFKKIVKQIPTLKKIKLQGMGEPFLNPELHNILEFGHKHGIKFTTITNGTVLDRNIELIKYFDEIAVSLDTTDKEQYKNIRKGGELEKVLSNIKKAILFKKENNLNTKIRINAVITHLNVDEIPKLIQLAIKLGLDSVGFVEVENWKTPVENDYEKELEFVLKARERSKEIKSLIEFYRKNFTNIQIRFLPSDKRKKACFWPFYSCFITVDGFVTPCCIRMNPDVINFGNVFEKNFKEIWNSDKYKKFRKTIICNLPNPICDNCPN